ncbi:hypothetical protein VE02_09808 [Pseudogymnoascus sp. 03VT05]|nr:hypothetical protein VE02_09808 [Pseudogymnoascus sp. 03VT05]
MTQPNDIPNNVPERAAEPIETEFLIVGTGPAGAALACFLGSHGIKGIMIGANATTADTPRAHITNAAALECLRDIGLEEACIEAAADGAKCMAHTRWCRSMAGEEYARTYSWGNNPNRHTHLEPILVRKAALSGFKTRFDTTFISFSRSTPISPIFSTVRDNISKQDFVIKSKYLFGCDGARSQVIRQLQIPLIKKPGQGLAINCLVKADLSHLVEHRVENLHWIMQPGEGFPAFGWTAIVRMVRPWNKWMFILFPAPGSGTDFVTSDQEYLKRIKELIGDDSVAVELLDVSKWFINETVAEHYSDGNIFCLGDAVHRHPPFNGLGSNTCIQDAFNLAWKVAYVQKGLANPTILDTYSLERQPVGLELITRANQGLRDHAPIWESLGIMEPTVEASKRAVDELSASTAAGRKRRILLKEGIERTANEFHGLGIEMNQRYQSSAMYLADEEPRPPLPENPVQDHEITTYPGSRLPHAWLNFRLPGKKFSTIDLAGHGAFCLFTGIGGEAWKSAAKQAQELLGVEVRVYSIGWKQDVEDVYFDWARRREVEEDGCVLVRPDRFVCWRARTMVDSAEAKLIRVLKSVLSLEYSS